MATSTARSPSADIAIINESTVCSDEEIKSYIAALQQQITEDFSPTWGADARLTFASKKRQTKAASNAWWLAVLDNSDQAGALGYHDLTPQGLPISKVFAASDKRYNLSVSVTMSHELLEMLGDPGINRTITATDDKGNMVLYAYEACDACEDDSYGYTIGGVTVSDFVYPEWFGGEAGSQFDHGKHLTKPLEILPGGYIGMWTPTAGWTQVTGKDAHGQQHRSRADVGSRRERRRVGPQRWARSTMEPTAPWP